jgi:hypothetical protein
VGTKSLRLKPENDGPYICNLCRRQVTVRQQLHISPDSLQRPVSVLSPLSFQTLEYSGQFHARCHDSLAETLKEAEYLPLMLTVVSETPRDENHE